MLGQLVIYHAPTGDQAAIVVLDHGDGRVNLVTFSPYGLATFHGGAQTGAFQYFPDAPEGSAEGMWTATPPPPNPDPASPPGA